MSDPLWLDTGLGDDVDRLVAIANRVLAGEPIESFDLGEYEIFFVTGYCQRAAGLVDAEGNSAVGGDPE